MIFAAGWLQSKIDSSKIHFQLSSLTHQDRAQQLYSELIYDAINVDVIHADHTQQQRDNAVKAFREGKTWVLICTELISRGIDFLGVNLVINFDFPASAISYIHRIGRTGRANRRGRAITYFTQDDKPKLRGIANILKSSGCNVPDYMLTIKKRSKKVRRELEKTAVKREDISVRDPTKKFKGQQKNFKGPAKEFKKGGLKRKAGGNDAANGDGGKNVAEKKRKISPATGENQSPKKKNDKKKPAGDKSKEGPAKQNIKNSGPILEKKKKTNIVKKKKQKAA